MGARSASQLGYVQSTSSKPVMAWQKERVAKGYCVKCHNRSHVVETPLESKQGVFCREHREENRLRCLAWAKKNREKIRAESHRRKELGICENNPAHGKATHGRLCYECRLRKREQSKAYDEKKARTTEGLNSRQSMYWENSVKGPSLSRSSLRSSLPIALEGSSGSTSSTPRAWIAVYLGAVSKEASLLWSAMPTTSRARTKRLDGI